MFNFFELFKAKSLKRDFIIPDKIAETIDFGRK